MKCLVCIFSVILLFAPSLSLFTEAQRSFYIRPENNIHGNGTKEQAFSDWKYAMQTLKPGDTLFVLPGNYHLMSEIRLIHPGSDHDWITIKASDSDDKPVIIPGDRIALQIVGKKNYRFEGIEFDGQWTANQLVVLRAAFSKDTVWNNNITFSHCKFHRSSRDGISAHMTNNLLIEESEIAYCLRYENGNRKDAHGIAYSSGSKISVIGCNIHHCSGDGIQVGIPMDFPVWDTLIVSGTEIWGSMITEDINGTSAGTWVGENAIDTKTPDSISIDSIQPGYRGKVFLTNVTAHGFRGKHDWAAFNIKFTVDATLINCIAYDNGIGYRLRGSYDWGQGIRGAQVRMINCLAYDNYSAALWPEQNIDRLEIWNCTFDKPKDKYWNDRTPVYFESRTSFNTKGWNVKNSLFVGNLEKPVFLIDPSVMRADENEFVDYKEHNYKLAPHSRAIDKGVSIPEASVDYEGLMRPQGKSFDLGAYEFKVN